MNLTLAALCSFVAGAALSGLMRQRTEQAHPPAPTPLPPANQQQPPPEPPPSTKIEIKRVEAAEPVQSAATPIPIRQGLAAEDRALNIDRRRPFVVATRFSSPLQTGEMRVQLAIVHAPDIKFKREGFRSSSRHGYVERDIETGGYTLLR